MQRSFPFTGVMKMCMLSLCLVFSILTIRAQEKKKLSGHVQEANGAPVSGATIQDDNGKPLGQTDKDGNFTVEVSGPLKRIRVNYVGYKLLEVPIGSISKIVLIQTASALDDVVIVGYGTQSRKKVTGAVSSLNGDVIRNTPAVSFDAMLEGRIAAVSVQSSSGEPGAKTNIVIRGSTNVDYGNFNGGNTQPLYVIDGVILDQNNMQGAYALSNPLSLINPNEIESIDVLKDASAAAIYGARGGNGVIIVKTRRVGAKRPRVTLNAYGGMVTAPRLMKVITGNAERLLKLQQLNGQLPYEDIANGNIPVQLTDSLNPAFNNNVNWQGMLIRNATFLNNQDLAVAGAFDNRNSYRFGVSHYNEQGAVRGYGIDRIAPNLNLQLNPVPKLSVGLSLQMSKEKRNHGAGVSGNPYLFVSGNFPTSLARLSQSQVDLYSGKSNRFDDNNLFLYNTSLRLTDTLTKDLSVTTTYGMQNVIDKYAYFSPKELNGIQNVAYDINASNPNWTWETFATYLKRLGDHTLSLVGGFSAYQAKQYYNSASAAGISVSGVYTVQTVPAGANLNVASSVQTKTTQSYYGRFDYDYKGKYMLSGSLRRDASSIYSADNRWGTFYAVSGGWNIADEHFFEPLKKVINSFKIRGSYGVTGQDPGSWYGKYQQLFADASFLGATTGAVGGPSANPYLTGTPIGYNGTTVVTPFPFYNGFYSNSTKSGIDVRWERYPQADLGFDWSMFNNRVNFVVDWYQKSSKDKYLWMIPAGSTTGYAYYSGNYADLTNRGLEVTVNTTNMGPRSAFQWNTNFNIAFNKGWITKLPNGNKDMLFGESWWQKTLSMGEPLFTYRDYITDGVYATDADVPTDPITGKKITYFGATTNAGDSKIIDQNGDYNINLDDKVNTGKSAMPTVTGGFSNYFSYKAFSLSVFANYSFGNYLINGTLSDALNGSRYQAWGEVAGPAGVYSSILNQFWAASGQQTTYPRLVYGTGTAAQDPWNVARDYFLNKGGYIRIQQIVLAYTLPQRMLNRLNFKGLRVYATLNNVHTFKQSEALVDPTLFDYTTGSSNSTYPSSMKTTIGVDINF
ncbi:TonB-linked SusC/RagA family outer membrane protein [Filimonas zeae]|nr:SusC/RagA family TonB-linked outer membrane protein [Filimonas zeae]MDR6337631.1 TonB-linked SusC/RagA family outer membrane protein [Filimonas zeae]